MGQSTSVFGIDREDWPNVILSSLLVNVVYALAYVPIWNRPSQIQEYLKEKNTYRKYLLNPKYWYDGFTWFIIFLFGVGTTIYRLLHILRTAKDTELQRIHCAEVGLLVATIQLGIHGMWAVAWFYWRQAGWSIVTMAIALALSVGAYVPIVIVDPWISSFAYGVYILAQLIFVIGNVILFIGGYDPKVDALRNPLMLYFKHKTFPLPKKRKRRET